MVFQGRKIFKENEFQHLTFPISNWAERAARFARRLGGSEEQFVRLALHDLVFHGGLKYRATWTYVLATD